MSDIESNEGEPVRIELRTSRVLSFVKTNEFETNEIFSSFQSRWDYNLVLASIRDHLWYHESAMGTRRDRTESVHG